MSFTSMHWGAYRPQVVDGKLEAMTPVEWDPDPSPIGASIPEAITSPTRILRPAVRRSYLAEPGSHPELRGQEPFVEVSWEVALDLVAGQLKQVKAEHGNQAIFGGSYGWGSAGRFHHAQSQLHRFLNQFGGYVFSMDSYSLGAGRVLMPHIVGNMDWLLAAHTSWKNLARHCELFVAFGGLPAKNAQTSPGGASEHLLSRALDEMSEAGVQFVNISPLRDDLTGPQNIQWLPVRPGSDTALMLALSYVLVSEGLHNEDFVRRYTVGYETFREYLLGHADGQPKDPLWAQALTDIPAQQIIDLARRMACQRTLINVAYSLQRSVHGEQPFWMTVTLAALLGQIGLPGGGFGLGYGCMNNTGSGRKAFSGPRFPQGVNPVKDFIPVARVTDMLLNPGAPFDYNGKPLHYPHIRLVYWAGGNIFHHHQDLNRLLEAWKRPETIVVHEQFWTAQAKYSDIVLPATTALERNDIGSSASDRFMIAMHQAIEPVGESRDDYSILADIASAWVSATPSPKAAMPKPGCASPMTSPGAGRRSTGSNCRTTTPSGATACLTSLIRTPIPYCSAPSAKTRTPIRCRHLRDASKFSANASPALATPIAPVIRCGWTNRWRRSRCNCCRTSRKPACTVNTITAPTAAPRRSASVSR
nr:molybdopterin-dependent oxidoreductase [Pseudomonas sp. VI4.1]